MQTLTSLKQFIDAPQVVGTISPSRRLVVAAFATAAMRLPGDVVEVGVHTGETARMLDAVRRNYNESGGVYAKKDLYLYDSFQGLPKVHPNDDGCPPNAPGMFHLGKVPERLPGRVIVGDIMTTMPEALPRYISFAHIDLDLYEPTLQALRFISPRVARTGYIVVDDYGHPAWPGVKKAVDEFMKEGFGATLQEWVFDSFPEACQAVISH